MEAEACCRRTLALRPNHADTLSNLGNALRALERYEEARAVLPAGPGLETGLSRGPQQPGRHSSGPGAVCEAEACCRQALELESTNAEVHNNFGHFLRDLGRHAGSLASYQRALALHGHFPEARFNASMVMLLLGDYERGWTEYEWRRQLKLLQLPTYPQPPWDGSALAGQTILLHTEQGLGDTLQFVRYAPLVKQQGGTVLLDCSAGAGQASPDLCRHRSSPRVG